MERARRHYAAHEFAASLAVLRLVGEEEAWLAADEQVEYAAMRGLTDIRLAGTVREGPERRALVECGREWLEVAQRREAAHPGAISAEMSLRIRDTLAGLIGLGPTTGECVEPTP